MAAVTPRRGCILSCGVCQGKGGSAQSGEVCTPPSASKSLQEIYTCSGLGIDLLDVWLEGEASVKCDAKVLGIGVIPYIGAVEFDVERGIGTAVSEMEHGANCLRQAQL